MVHYRKNALRTQRIGRPPGCVQISEQMDPISKHLKFLNNPFSGLFGSQMFAHGRANMIVMK